MVAAPGALLLPPPKLLLPPPLALSPAAQVRRRHRDPAQRLRSERRAFERGERRPSPPRAVACATAAARLRLLRDARLLGVRVRARGVLGGAQLSAQSHDSCI